MTNGWKESAQAWIKDMGEYGDKGRRYILDPAMIKRIEGRDFKNALDVGCGEGRFCRILQKYNIKTTGIDPIDEFIAEAIKQDPNHPYIKSFAEKLPFDDDEFDLVVSYMSLIDIPDYKIAIDEMVRVLKPNGTLLIANLTSLNTSAAGLGWQSGIIQKDKFYAIDNYMHESEAWEEWRGIRIKNYHRPLSHYMTQFLKHDLILRHFEEPLPIGGNPEWQKLYARAPNHMIMEWQKPNQ